MGTVLKGNAVVGQSGGPTRVINQSLVGVIEAVAGSDAIDQLLGARHGVRGIVEEKFIDLKGLASRTAGARGRDALRRPWAPPATSPTRRTARRSSRSSRKNNVRYFFYIGGNDSADTARIVNELANAGRTTSCASSTSPRPSTTTCACTDHCPGYGSAAKFVACAFMGDDLDNASLPGVKIDVVMGRNAGLLTAASVLGRQDDTDGPAPDLRARAPVQPRSGSSPTSRRSTAAWAAAWWPSPKASRTRPARPGRPKIGRNRRARQPRQRAALRLRRAGRLLCRAGQDKRPSWAARSCASVADTFGYLQRSFAGFACASRPEGSPPGRAEGRRVRPGRRIQRLAWPSDARARGDKYGIECFRAKLKDVARETKDLPPDFIAENGHDVTDAFRRYALPLTSGVPKIGKLF